jgi:predicted enzyme related to lactoylglutathione lyase
MKIKGVDFVLYNVSDYKRAVAFYRDVLGLKLVDEYRGYFGEFAVGKVTLAICAGESVSKGGAMVALAVDDVNKAVEYLKSKKVKVIEKPHETEVCFMATIADPDGNEIKLHQRKDGTVG